MPTRAPIASWIEIRSDDAILVRTGRAELSVRPEAIILIMGDTDRTRDGGYSAGFMTGAANLRKVSAYTYQALLQLATKQLGVPVAALSVKDALVSGGGRSIGYGQLVQGQQTRFKNSSHRRARQICSRRC